MASDMDARLGLWTDYSRHYLDRWQILATDFWAQCMTALVAVCLTLTSPYVFKIAASFLVWLTRGFERLAVEWKSADEARLASESTVSSTPNERARLNAGKRPTYGAVTPQDLLKKGGNHSSSTPLDVSKVPVHDHSDPDHSRSSQAYKSSSPRSLKTSASRPEDQSCSSLSVSPRNSVIRQDGATESSKRTDQAKSRLRKSRSSSDEEGQTQSDNDAVLILQSAEDSRDTVWKFAKYIIHGSKKQVKSPSTPMIVITTVLFGLFVAQSVAGVFSAKVASDRSGLSSSSHCGLWQFDDKAGGEAADRNDLKNYHEEARASQYARNCYNSPDPTSTLSCRLFYNQSIAFTTQNHQMCPFSSSELCEGGLHSAVKFDTGLVDASIIGINAAGTHKFRRTTSCSPLNMSETYIKHISPNTNDTIYEYYYGTKDSTNYTLRTSGQPFDWLVPVYSLNTYFSSLYPERDYWQPIRELQRPEGSTLTILFVSSMHIYHVEPSFDPIFNAQEPRHFPDLREPYYYNSDPRARAFACVDTSELCAPDGDKCWSMTASTPPKAAVSPAYWLMKWSLENSNSYDSIKWRLGSALLAQESVSQSVSNPLRSNQWQLEASQLFATSLARIQYDAWKIASGEDHDRAPEYKEVTPDEAKGRLCGLYKYRTPDYTNVNLAAFIGLIVLAFTIFVLSWNMSAYDVRDGDSQPSNPLVIDIIAKFFASLAFTIIVGLGKCVAFPFHKVWARLAKRNSTGGTNNGIGERSSRSNIVP